jgi:hypothetical protein
MAEVIEYYAILSVWGDRKESADECAVRAEAFFNSIAKCDPALGHWFKRGWSRKEALKYRIPPDAETLRKMFLAGRSWTDGRPRKLMGNLGFHISMWNGASRDERRGLRGTEHPVWWL